MSLTCFFQEIGDKWKIIPVSEILLRIFKTVGVLTRHENHVIYFVPVVINRIQ
jgi:hypothetical protein